MGIWTKSKQAKHEEKLQDKQNQANLELHQMDNNFNERMAEKANQWNIDQWNREVAQQNLNWERDAEYNSASAQVKRYREAGLNPTIMMQGQGAGSASSQSVPHASSATASAAAPIPMGKANGVYPDYNQVFGNLQNSLNQFVDSTLKVEQVQGMKLDNRRKQQQMLYDLMEAQNRAEGGKYDNFLKKQELREKEAIEQSHIDDAKYKAETSQYIRNKEKELAEYQRLVTQGAPEKLAAELSKIKFESSVNWEKQLEAGINIAEKFGIDTKTLINTLSLWLNTPAVNILKQLYKNRELYKRLSPITEPPRQ